MLTIRGTQEKLTQLNDSLNIHYKYPNEETLTLTYSAIQQEYLTNDYCLMILAKDRAFAEAVEGVVIQDGNTIATAPIEPMPAMEEPVVVPEII